ncbi:MAG: tRNA pseudouridine(65) synthase TruC, partial [Neisseria sp.]|nr:tRNA pseudouridine(65) synthase TruC [Neisseria sp.]
TSRYSWLELTPETGRKHQLRRHLKHIFHPIVGDTNYGDLRQNKAIREHLNVHRLMLHARSLSFTRLSDSQQQTVTAPVDENWQRLAEAFGWTLQQK